MTKLGDKNLTGQVVLFTKLQVRQKQRRQNDKDEGDDDDTFSKSKKHSEDELLSISRQNEKIIALNFR